MARTYAMTAEQTAEWEQGGDAALRIEDEIAADILDNETTDDVDVLTWDGAVAYTFWQPGKA